MVTRNDTVGRGRWGVRALGWLLATLLVASCTNGGDDGDDGAAAGGEAGGALDVAAVVGRVAEAGSASYVGSVSVTDPTRSPDPAVVDFDGRYDEAASANTIVVRAEQFVTSEVVADELEVPTGFDGVFAEPIEATVLGDQAWVQLDLLGDGVWASVSRFQLEALAGGFGVQALIVRPTRSLEWLAGGDATVTDLGQEDLDGVAVRRWQALVDLASAKAAVEADEVDDFEAAFGTGTGEIAIELWVDEATGDLVRYDLPLPGSTFGGPEATTQLSMTLSSLGEAPAVEPPDPADVVEGESIFSLLGF